MTTEKTGWFVWIDDVRDEGGVWVEAVSKENAIAQANIRHDFDGVFDRAKPMTREEWSKVEDAG